METLLYFAVWAAFVWLMSRHLQTPTASSKGNNLGLRWVPPAKDVDPVCGKTVATDRAKPSVYAGNVYYFCSRECREVFEAAPDLYLGNGDADQHKFEHSHA